MVTTDDKPRDLGVRTWRESTGEGEAWVAQWIHYDICGQGSTETEALKSLERCIAAQALLDASDGIRPFENLGPPPPNVVERANALHDAEHA